MSHSEQLPISPGANTLGSIVAERPGTAVVFEKLGLDYCCGGQQSLEDACRSADLEPGTVAKLLATLDGEAAESPSGAHDLSGASIDEICDHIVTAHHDPLRGDVVRISELMTKVVRAHGAEDPEVIELAELFGQTRTELETHMRREEDFLFPACREIAASENGRSPDDGLLAELDDEHQSAGDALRQMRILSDDYRPETAHCTTHRVLRHEMHEFELELHRHIHEENNILFPRVREMATPGETP